MLEQELKQKKANKSNSVLPGEDYPIPESIVQVHEKRTRFSLSHDQDSIGEWPAYVVILFAKSTNIEFAILLATNAAIV